MRNPYRSAVDLLPHDLLEAVSKALGGRSAFLWVPAARNIERANRAAYVLQLVGDGLSQGEIADQLFISKSTVKRIVAHARALAAPPAMANSAESRNPDLQTPR